MPRRFLSAAAVAAAAGLSPASAFMASTSTHAQTGSTYASILQRDGATGTDICTSSSRSRIPTARRSQTSIVAAASAAATTLSTDGCPLGLAEIDDANFRDLLQDDSGKAVLVNACAPWCGPCKLIKPVVERAAGKWAKAVHVVKYDVENEDAAQFKAMLHDELGVKISALPTLILLKDGRHVSSRSGVVTDMDVNTFLSRNLHKARTATAGGGGDEEQ